MHKKIISSILCFTILISSMPIYASDIFPSLLTDDYISPTDTLNSFSKQVIDGETYLVNSTGISFTEDEISNASGFVDGRPIYGEPIVEDSSYWIDDSPQNYEAITATLSLGYVMYMLFNLALSGAITYEILQLGGVVESGRDLITSDYGIKRKKEKEKEVLDYTAKDVVNASRKKGKVITEDQVNKVYQNISTRAESNNGKVTLTQEEVKFFLPAVSAVYETCIDSKYVTLDPMKVAIPAYYTIADGSLSGGSEGYSIWNAYDWRSFNTVYSLTQKDVADFILVGLSNGFTAFGSANMMLFSNSTNVRANATYQKAIAFNSWNTGSNQYSMFAYSNPSMNISDAKSLTGSWSWNKHGQGSTVMFNQSSILSYKYTDYTRPNSDVVYDGTVNATGIHALGIRTNGGASSTEIANTKPMYFPIDKTVLTQQATDTTKPFVPALDDYVVPVLNPTHDIRDTGAVLDANIGMVGAIEGDKVVELPNVGDIDKPIDLPILGDMLGALEGIWDSVVSFPGQMVDFFTAQPTTKIDLSPLEISLIDKFPFCLPFDLYNAFVSFSATPEVPSFEVKFDEGLVGSASFTFDFTPFTKLAAILRYFILLVFVTNLIKKTREFIGG